MEAKVDVARGIHRRNFTARRPSISVYLLPSIISRPRSPGNENSSGTTRQGRATPMTAAVHRTKRRKNGFLDSSLCFASNCRLPPSKRPSVAYCRQAIFNQARHGYDAPIIGQCQRTRMPLKPSRSTTSIPARIRPAKAVARHSADK